MSVTIDLAPDLEAWLQREAARSGLDKGTYIVHAIQERLLRSDASHPPQAEEDLLQRINEGPSEQTWHRFHDLAARRQARALTPEQHAELVALTEQIERANADRMGYLARLASLRRRSLRDVMKDLGIAAPAPL